MVEVLNEYGEADWVVRRIEQQIGGSDMLRGSQHHTADQQQTFSDFAVLYRTHALAKTLQQALEKSGIPYQVAGEGSPYLRPEIQAITDSLAYIADEGVPPVIKGKRPAHIRRLLDVLRAQALPLVPMVEQIIAQLSLQTERNGAVIRQCTNSLVRFAELPITNYLAHVQLLSEQEYYDPEADAITLLTVHAAKGLEFAQVFLLAAEQGILPLARKGMTVDTDEERRLFYVAATRARDDLYVMHARASEPANHHKYLSL